MSNASAQLESLAATHGVSSLILLEWFLERVAIMTADHIPERIAEELAIEGIEAELEGRK